MLRLICLIIMSAMSACFIKSSQYYDAWNSLCKTYNSQIHILSALSAELFNIKPVKSGSAIHFQEFKDKVTTILTRLKTFNIDLGSTEPLFVRYFIRKLSNASLKYFYFVMDEFKYYAFYGKVHNISGHTSY